MKASKITFLFVIFLMVNNTYAQDSLNMIKVSEWADINYPNTHPFNDIWGYVDGSGNEYAILASRDSVHFINVTDPLNPVQVDAFKGNGSSGWRDMKTYGTYAFSSSEYNGDGLAVYDLSNLPTSVTKVLHTTTYFNESHNIYVDTAKAKLYAVGSAWSSGMRILDISTPASPTLLATVTLPGGYVHDVFVRNDTAYCSHGNNGLYVYDVSTPASPITLGTLTTYSENGYNHSGWLTDDGNHYVFCDETHGKSVKIADVSDLSNILVKDLFKSELLAPTHTNSIAHNPFIKGDSVYLSYYHDGVQVFDISNPTNVVQTAYYDTEDQHTGYSGYWGVWGCYPFLPSGNIIASDRRTGLNILQFASSAALRVELTDFIATATGQKILLNWTTESEVHHDRFEIERSKDGIHFEMIATVTGEGSQFERKDYSLWDERPFLGKNYYRLKQIDQAGNFVFSKVVFAEILQAAFVEIYPTILESNESISLRLKEDIDSKIDLKIINSNGQVVAYQSFENSPAQAVLTIETESLSTGIYFIKFEIGSIQVVEKIVVK